MGCQQSKLPETKDQNDLTTKEQLKTTSSTIKVTVKRFGDTDSVSSGYEKSDTATVKNEQRKDTSSTTKVTVKSFGDTGSDSSDYEDSDDEEVLGDWFEQDDFVAYEPKATPKNEEVSKTPVESCEFFLKFPETYRKQLIGVMDKITFNDGDEIIKQGRSSNRMYVITEGEAVVMKKKNKRGGSRRRNYTFVRWWLFW